MQNIGTMGSSLHEGNFPAHGCCSLCAENCDQCEGGMEMNQESFPVQKNPML